MSGVTRVYETHVAVILKLIKDRLFLDLWVVFLLGRGARLEASWKLFIEI
jgi:hypothetical protein